MLVAKVINVWCYLQIWHISRGENRRGVVGTLGGLWIEVLWSRLALGSVLEVDVMKILGTDWHRCFFYYFYLEPSNALIISAVVSGTRCHFFRRIKKKWDDFYIEVFNVLELILTEQSEIIMLMEYIMW